MEHTKGPWEVRDGYSKHVKEIVGPHREAICATHNWLKTDPVEESEANAKLIAAAPELLDALKQTSTSLKADGNGGIRNQNAIERAEAAINKATT